MRHHLSIHPSPPTTTMTSIIDAPSEPSPVTRALQMASKRSRTWAGVLCDQMLVSGTSFLTTVLIGRILGKSQLGLYVLAYSVVIVLLEVQNSLIASPYTINRPRLNAASQAAHTGNALALSIGLSALATIVLLIINSTFPGGLGLSELKPPFLSLALIAAPILVKEFGRRVCFAHLNTRGVLLIDVTATVIQVGGLLLLMSLGSASVCGVYLLIAAASGTAAVMWLLTWRRRTAVTSSGPLVMLRETWSFGMWVLTGNLALVLSQQLYPWYLAWLRGPDAAGAFAACAGLLALINPLVSAVGNYLGPITANAHLRGGRELSRVVRQASVLLFLVVGVFCAVMIFEGSRLLLVLYGTGYRVDPYIFAILAASVLASTCTLALGFGFWAVGRPDINLKINLVSTITAVSIGPALVGTYGLVGAAYGLLAANTAVSLLRLLLLRRVLHRRQFNSDAICLTSC